MLYDLLLWLGTILMLIGLLGFMFGFSLFFAPIGMFMFGSTWNMVLMMLGRVGLIDTQ